jgi:hypothetical protein
MVVGGLWHFYKRVVTKWQPLKCLGLDVVNFIYFIYFILKNGEFFFKSQKNSLGKKKKKKLKKKISRVGKSGRNGRRTI